MAEDMVVVPGDLIVGREDWQSDKASKSCPLCEAKFTLLHRRHHCRVCGCLACSNCVPEDGILRKGHEEDMIKICEACKKKCRRREAEELKNEKLKAARVKQARIARAAGAEETKMTLDSDVDVTAHQNQQQLRMRQQMQAARVNHLDDKPAEAPTIKIPEDWEKGEYIVDPVLLKKEDEWVKDSQRQKCPHCEERFTEVLRRHHCRSCGEVLCTECAPYVGKPATPMAFTEFRMCKHCCAKTQTERIQKETEEFQKKVRIHEVAKQRQKEFESKK